MAVFLHELIQYAHSNVLCEKMLHHKHYIWMASFLHELIQYAHSGKMLNISWLISEKLGFLASPVSYFKEDNFTATDLAACVVE